MERQSQKKDISPLLKTKREINIVKGVSIVDHCAELLIGCVFRGIAH